MKKMSSSKFCKPAHPLILIVEDNRVNQLLLMKKFENHGFASIQLAKNGQEAMAMALKDNPDLILMDIQLPDMNGNSVILGLREKKFKGQIVALSADAAPEDKERSFQAGANGYITKPINFDVFFTQLNDFLPLPSDLGKNGQDKELETEKMHVTAATLPDRIDPAISEAAKNIFMQDGKEKLQIMAEALAHADDEEQLAKIKAIAHEYKGNASYFGLKELETLARELDMGFADQQPQEQLIQLTRKLVSLVERILHENS